ncbi:hypothetical protein CDAR_403181 [Caerostris darwini]|uniref:Uncharacterized protein n=1 Tax=Caerostris darwini TaxID=1538125 RepID=A0AAV4WZX6_9ARAC|nr:hypothetical protein CDAR_403181 [Caerostris darwini]
MMIVAPETVIHRAEVGVEFRDDDVEARSWMLMSRRCRACSCAVSRHLWSRAIYRRKQSSIFIPNLRYNKKMFCGFEVVAEHVVLLQEHTAREFFFSFLFPSCSLLIIIHFLLTLAFYFHRWRSPDANLAPRSSHISLETMQPPILVIISLSWIWGCTDWVKHSGRWYNAGCTGMLRGC